MKYTSHCRAQIIAKVSSYLYEKMLNGNPAQKIEAEYDLADSMWFRGLCNAVKVEEYDAVILSLHNIHDDLEVMKNNSEYSYASREIFKNRQQLVEEIVTIINNCINGK